MKPLPRPIPRGVRRHTETVEVGRLAVVDAAHRMIHRDLSRGFCVIGEQPAWLRRLMTRVLSRYE